MLLTGHRRAGPAPCLGSLGEIPRAWGQKNGPCPWPTVAHGWAGPTPHWGSVGELVLVARWWDRDRAYCVSVEELTLLLAWVKWTIRYWWQWCREAQANQLSYHPDPDSGLWVVHPNIYPICEMLVCVKGLVQRNQRYRSPWRGKKQDSREESQ